MNARLSRIAVVLFVLLVAFFALARRDFSERNLRFFPEMADSLALEPQRTSTILPSSNLIRPAVPGTIARGYVPFAYSASEGDKMRAGIELRNPYPPSLGTLQRGEKVYRNSCRHCHGPTGRGDGAVAQRVSTFAMSIVGKASSDLPDGTLYHILTYGQNNMPPHAVQVDRSDRWMLIHYLRDLQHAETARLASLGITLQEDPRKTTLVSTQYGHEIFETNCASCHGTEGRSPQLGVPMLNSPRVLAVADDDYYLDIITHGRKGSDMPAWGKVLEPTQIQSLTAYVRSWSPLEADRSKIVREAGSLSRGRALYRGNCAPCHGISGKGGIGSSLRSNSFLALASDAFLRDTIVRGRSHTAMPAAHDLAHRDISDILAYLRSWSRPNHTFEDVEALLPKASKRIGKRLYRARCSSCHGKKGEGGIGSRLASQSFLAMADDRFLHRSIVEGRPGTAMPSWHFLEAEDAADLIAYIRDWQEVEPVVPKARAGQGRAEFGELIYLQGCVSCHGLEGAGGVGNQIANRTFLDSVSDSFLWRTIAYGKDGTAMRGFLKGKSIGALMPMSESDIDHIVAYLRRLQREEKVEPLNKPRNHVDVAMGEEIYHAKGGCAECHGLLGEGASGPALGNHDFLKVASDGYLAGTLVLGRENTEMLSFARGGNVDLSGREIESVVAYVRSFESLAPTLRRGIDQTETAVAAGATLFRANCASCHGTEGKGPRNNEVFDGYAPSLNNAEFLHAAEDGLLLATIAMGRPGTAMRGFATGSGGIADLSAKDIRNIVAYMRTWEAPPSEEPAP